MKSGSRAKKRVDLLMKGVRATWKVTDPLGDGRVLEGSTLTSTNYANAIKMKQPEFMAIVTEELFKTPFKWHVNLEMEFDDGLQKYYKGAVIVAVSTLDGVDESYAETVEHVFSASDMEHYVTTHVTMTILGTSPIKEADFA
jgi:hypothetical protein